MRAPRSLQGRLAFGLGLGIALLWILATAITLQVLRHELDEVFDSALEETAQRILPLAALDIIGRDEGDVSQRVATLRQHKEYYTYIVRDAQGAVLLRSHEADDAVFPPFAGVGFVDTPTHRIYFDAALQGTITIAIAEPLAHRQSVADRALFGLALPLALLIPLSLLGVWWMVRRSMAPIRALRKEIESRGGGDLAPVATERLPSEIEPVAEAVNRLMGRLRSALEAERSFTANAAHELRTPVAAALAQAQRLLAETTDPAVRPRAQQIETALQRLSRLSAKLLQLAKAEGARLEMDQAADIVPILRLTVAELAQEAGGAGRIEASLPASPVLSKIDPDAFAILARNLIENALKHGTRDAPVQVSLSPDGALTVINAGPLVPPEKLAHLLRPFERGQTDAEGTGLGLAIAKAIASGAGGELTLTSPAEGLSGGFEARFRVRESAGSR